MRQAGRLPTNCSSQLGVHFSDAMRLRDVWFGPSGLVLLMAKRLNNSSAEWMSMARLTEYADVSLRTLSEWIRDPVDPLPASQVGRKILVRRSDFDAFLQRHRRTPDTMVKELLDELS